MIKVDYLKSSPEARIDNPHYEGDVGYDIYSIEEKILFPFFPQVVGTGVSLSMPFTTYCTIETRSGHGVKNNLRCHRGIIDSGYRGKLSVKVYNHGWKPYRIKKGEKIAQIVFHPVLKPFLKEVKELDTTFRGEKGFGSSNKNKPEGVIEEFLNHHPNHSRGDYFSEDKEKP
jgi:dUTP pyrophosphatase